jgi:hypothetical protein
MMIWWTIAIATSWGDARIREREAQRAAEATESASEAEEDLDFEARAKK